MYVGCFAQKSFPNLDRTFIFLFRRLQVFTSASTAAFKIFACDDDVVDGESFLRADFSISCKSGMYTFFQVYAVLMILVSCPASQYIGRGQRTSLLLLCQSNFLGLQIGAVLSGGVV